MVETEIAETCRTRFQVTFGTQVLDNAYITMPPSFAAMESIRDASNGELLHLVDEWSGGWSDFYEPMGSAYGQVNPSALARSYRLTGDCIELLPHPVPPDPPRPDLGAAIHHNGLVSKASLWLSTYASLGVAKRYQPNSGEPVWDIPLWSHKVRRNVRTG